MATGGERIEESYDLPVAADSWIDALSHDQLKSECERRGLKSVGILPTLRARIRRYERDTRTGQEDGRARSAEVPARGERGDARTVTGTRPREQLENGDDEDDEDSDLENEYEARVLKRVEPVRAGDTRHRVTTEAPSRKIAKGERDATTPPKFEGDRNTRIPEKRRPLTWAETCNAVRRWDLSFSGAPGEDVEEFLESVRDARGVLEIGDTDLIQCLPYLLSKKARSWYRAEKSGWGTWEEFARDLSEWFGVEDPQFALRDQILHRTQGENEAVSDYLICMKSLFRGLNPAWTDSDELTQIYRNLLPRYRAVVKREEFTDFKTLTRLVRRAERNRMERAQYKAPPPPEDSYRAQYAYQPPKRNPRPAITFVANGQGDTSGGRTPVAPPDQNQRSKSPAFSRRDSSGDRTSRDGSVMRGARSRHTMVDPRGSSREERAYERESRPTRREPRSLSRPRRDVSQDSRNVERGRPSAPPEGYRAYRDTEYEREPRVGQRVYNAPPPWAREGRSSREEENTYREYECPRSRWKDGDPYGPRRGWYGSTVDCAEREVADRLGPALGRLTVSEKPDRYGRGRRERGERGPTADRGETEIRRPNSPRERYDGEPDVCWRCGQYGHIARGCRQPGQPSRGAGAGKSLRRENSRNRPGNE